MRALAAATFEKYLRRCGVFCSLVTYHTRGIVALLFAMASFALGYIGDWIAPDDFHEPEEDSDDSNSTPPTSPS